MVAAGEFFRELPLGKGDVNFDLYFKALQAVNYTGYLTIEREVKDAPEADISQAVEFVRKYKL